MQVRCLKTMQRSVGRIRVQGGVWGIRSGLGFMFCSGVGLLCESAAVLQCRGQ